MKTKRTPKYDWRKFGKDTDLQQLYAVEVENQFSALCSLHDEENLTADQKYPLFIKAHNKAASKTLPERKRKQGSKVSWQDDSVVTARNQLNDVRKQYNESGSEQDKTLLESAKRNLDSTYERVEEGYVKEKVPPSNQLPKICRVV